MFASSNTTTKVRSTAGRASTLVETRVSARAGTDSGTTTGSKLVMAWGRPSSLIVKSSRRRPSRGFPRSSKTRTSTVTTSTPDGMTVAADGEGTGAWNAQAGWETAAHNIREAVRRAKGIRHEAIPRL